MEISHAYSIIFSFENARYLSPVSASASHAIFAAYLTTENVYLEYDRYGSSSDISEVIIWYFTYPGIQ